MAHKKGMKPAWDTAVVCKVYIRLFDNMFQQNAGTLTTF